jgi:hypothetical protein
VSRDARLDGTVIDRRHETGLQRRGVGADQRMQIQPMADFWQHGHAEFAASGEHEIHPFSGRFFRGADEIALVFPVFGVDHDHHLAARNRIDRRLDRRELDGFFRIYFVHGTTSAS